MLLNHLGFVVDWDCHTVNIYDGSAFQHMVDGVASVDGCANQGFGKADWFPANLRLCQPRGRNDRMLIETMLSMLTLVCGFKKMMHRAWTYFKTRVGLTMALFNILVQWQGSPAQEDGFVLLSIAQFSL